MRPIRVSGFEISFGVDKINIGVISKMSNQLLFNTEIQFSQVFNQYGEYLILVYLYSKLKLNFLEFTEKNLH